MMVKRFKNINPKDVENVELNPGSSEHFCGTPPEKVPKSLRHAHKEIGRALKSIIKERTKSKKNARLSSQPIITVPVMFHLYKRNDGSYTLTDSEVLNYITTLNSWLAGETGDNKKWHLLQTGGNVKPEHIGGYIISVEDFADTNSDTRIRVELLKAIPVEFLRRFMVPTQNVRDIHRTSFNYASQTTYNSFKYNAETAINFSKEHNKGIGSNKITKSTKLTMDNNYLGVPQGYETNTIPSYYPLIYSENNVLENRKIEALVNYEEAKLAYEENNNATTKANLETAKHIKDLGGFVSCGVDGVGSIIRYDDSLNPTGLREFLNGEYGENNNTNPLYNSEHFRFQRKDNNATYPGGFWLYNQSWVSNSGQPITSKQSTINSVLLEEYFYTLPCIHVHDFMPIQNQNVSTPSSGRSNAVFPSVEAGGLLADRFPSKTMLFNGASAPTFAHEIGHNIGLRHSHDIKGWFYEMYGLTTPSLDFNDTDPYREIDDSEVYFVRTYFDLLLEGFTKNFPIIHSNPSFNSGVGTDTLIYANWVNDGPILEYKIGEFLFDNIDLGIENSLNSPDRLSFLPVQTNYTYIQWALWGIESKASRSLPSWWTGSVNEDNQFVVNKPLLDEDGNIRSSANENGHVYTTRIPFCVLNSSGEPSKMYDPLWATKQNCYNPDFPAYPDNTLTSDLVSFEHCPCLWNDDGTAIGEYTYKTEEGGEVYSINFAELNDIETRLNDFTNLYERTTNLIKQDLDHVRSLLLANAFSSSNGVMPNFGYYGLNTKSLVPHYYANTTPDQRIEDNYKASKFSNNHRIAKYYLGQHGDPEGDFYNPSSIYVQIPTWADGIPREDGTILNFLGEEIVTNLVGQSAPIWSTEEQFVGTNPDCDWCEYFYNSSMAMNSFVPSFPQRLGNVGAGVITGKSFAGKSLFTFEGDETVDQGNYTYSTQWSVMNYSSAIVTSYDYFKDFTTYTEDVFAALGSGSPGYFKFQTNTTRTNFYSLTKSLPYNDVYTTADGAYMYSLLSLDVPFSRINIDYDEITNPDIPQTLVSFNSDLPEQSQETGYAHFRWINKFQTLIDSYNTDVNPYEYKTQNEYTPAFDGFASYLNTLAADYVESEIVIDPIDPIEDLLCTNTFAQNYQGYGDCVFDENFLIDNQICLNYTEAINWGSIFLEGDAQTIADYTEAVTALGGGQNLTDYCSFEYCPYESATNTYPSPDSFTSGGTFANTQINSVENCEFENFTIEYTSDGNIVESIYENPDDPITIVQYECGIPGALNYWGTLEETYAITEGLVIIDNGTCLFNIGGCMDPAACNFNPQATIQEGYCEYPTTIANYEFDGTLCQECVDGVLQESENCLEDLFTVGCTSSSYLEYNSSATFLDINLCQTLIVYGCTNHLFVEYNPDANIDNGYCVNYNVGCMDPAATNYDPEATVSPGIENNLYCDYAVFGCGNPNYEEYDPLVTETFYQVNPFTPNYCQTLTVIGCMDLNASNYDVNATQEGLCFYVDEDSTTTCSEVEQLDPDVIEVCSYPGIDQCSIALDFALIFPDPSFAHAQGYSTEVQYGPNIVNDTVYPEIVYAETDIYQETPCTGPGFRYKINNNLCYTGTLEYIGFLPNGTYATSDVAGLNPKNWASLDCSGSPYPVNNTFGFVQWPQHLYEGGVIIDKLPGGVNVDYDGENFEFNPDGIGLFEGKLPDMYSLFGGDFTGKHPVFYMQEGYTFGDMFIFGDTKDDYYSGPILKSSTGALFAGSFNSVGRSLFLSIEPKTVNLLVQEDKAKKVLEKIKSVQNICKFVKL